MRSIFTILNAAASLVLTFLIYPYFFATMTLMSLTNILIIELFVLINRIKIL